jgi:hypothetical protein
VNRPWVLAAAIFAGVFCVYLASPVATPFDSRWTVHTALSLIREHNADLNEFDPLLRHDKYYAIECVLPSGERLYPIADSSQCSGGRLYNFYPVAVPLLVSPFVAALAAARPLLSPFAAGMQPGLRRSLLEGDLAAASMPVELILASVIVAAAAAAVFFVVLGRSGSRAAILIALVFAFATPAWSTGSRALWMHGFSMLLLPAGLLCMTRNRWLAAGAVFALAFFVRPTNAIPLAFAGVWALRLSRKHALRFLLGVLPVAAVFTAISLQTYGTLLAPYSFVQRAATASLSIHPRLGEALLGNLVSPSRGLFVYSPVFLFSLYGIWLWTRSKDTRPAAMWVAAVTIAHYLLISSYEDWFGGHSYGPRYFSDLASLFAIALAPAWIALRKPARLLFCAALAASVFIHAQGAWCWPCVDWNSNPARIELSPHRLWDWFDPPFLR